MGTLDIAGAFDNVWHACLVAKLHAKGVQGALLLLEDYLHGITLQVVIGGQSSRSAIHASVPEGSILTNLLWLLYVDDIREPVKS